MAVDVDDADALSVTIANPLAFAASDAAAADDDDVTVDEGDRVVSGEVECGGVIDQRKERW